jgi:hypothetical protein
MLLRAIAPASATPATPVPDATHCITPPRSYAEVSALLANPNVATPSATTAGQTIPEGTPASAPEIDAINHTVRQWLACQNAGESLRAWSLFSDGYLYRLLSRQGGLTAADYSSLATPTPSNSEPATLVRIDKERKLSDRRLGATVTITYPSVPMPKTFFVYFTQSGSRLLIDGILGEISFSVP